MRSDCKGGGVSIYNHKFSNFIRNCANVNSKYKESLSVECILNKDCRNTLFSVLHRSPNCQIEPFKNFLTVVSSKTKSSNKAVDIADGFKLNLFDHDT